MKKIFRNTVFMCSFLFCGAGMSQEYIEKEQSTYQSDNVIGFESNFPQSDWDKKRQTARFAGAEPVLFLDDTFILGCRNITRSLHSLEKRLKPLSFPISENVMKSITVRALVPASDGNGLFVYCLGNYKDKSLFTIFRTTDGITFEPVLVNQIPSEKIWDDLLPNDRPQNNNVLNFNGLCGLDFTSYYTSFFKVPEEMNYPYRAIFISSKPRPRKAMILRSKNGLDWELMPHQNLHNVRYEANKPTYDPFQNRYLCYLRLWDPHNGPVSRWRKVLFNEAILTPDGVQWTDEELVLEANEADGPSTDIYYMQVTGYAGAYVGIPVLYHRPSSLDPELVGKFHCELAYSRDGLQWERVCQGQSILATGPAGTWDTGLVGISTNPVIINDSLYYYYQGRVNTHDEPLPADFHVDAGIATFRVDGFVSMDAGEQSGTLVTTSFWPKGKYLYINADASEGEIRVEVLQDYYYVELEKKNDPEQVKGLFRAENCIPLTEDDFAHRVEWKSKENFVDNFPNDWNEFLPEQKKKRTFSKRAIALKFYMKNAKLYSFWFADEKFPLEKGRLVPVTK